MTMSIGTFTVRLHATRGHRLTIATATRVSDSLKRDGYATLEHRISVVLRASGGCTSVAHSRDVEDPTLSFGF